MSSTVDSSATDTFAQRIINQDSDNPLAFFLLGEVTGVLYLGNSLVLFYADGRKTALAIDEEANIVVGDYDTISC